MIFKKAINQLYVKTKAHETNEEEEGKVRDVSKPIKKKSRLAGMDTICQASSGDICQSSWMDITTSTKVTSHCCDWGSTKHADDEHLLSPQQQQQHQHQQEGYPNHCSLSPITPPSPAQLNTPITPLHVHKGLEASQVLTSPAVVHSSIHYPYQAISSKYFLFEEEEEEESKDDTSEDNDNWFHPLEKLHNEKFWSEENVSEASATIFELDEIRGEMFELHNYKKVNDLGHGTDSFVYEVVDRRHATKEMRNSHVAMKLTKSKYGRVRTEINLLYQLRQCPHVVQLIDVLENMSLYVLILEQAFCSLEELLTQKFAIVPMSEHVAKSFISDTLKGIMAVHNLGFVHKGQLFSFFSKFVCICKDLFFIIIIIIPIYFFFF
ncbi:hypothetical protein RFI_06904 [Reticulomyxa filosa]|uniref:Protein kinase domain-containing protein n=1 Tax=Reticulomyxa filosa TaxID=46433 RepID=X6NV78_RETFI|nr:hypothetical protein RFI_06904 [Reticulomyxa filosa]|eukprot:ETO30215.1 hypothetical protein RFI_06904 [Reticulomyxa filosa]